MANVVKGLFLELHVFFNGREGLIIKLKKRYIGISTNKFGETTVYNLEKKRFYTYNEKKYTKDELKEIANKKSKKVLIFSSYIYPLFLLIVVIMTKQNITNSLLLYPTIASMLLITVLSYLHTNSTVNNNVYKYNSIMTYIDENEFRKKYFKDAIKTTMNGCIFLIIVILTFLLLLYFLFQLEDIKFKLILIMLIFVNCFLVGFASSGLSIVIKLKLYKKLKKQKGEVV